MKKLLVNLSILSILALVALPMVSCAPNEEGVIEENATENDMYEENTMEEQGEMMEEEGEEMEEMGEEMEDPMMEEEGEMMEEAGEEMQEEEPPAA